MLDKQTIAYLRPVHGLYNTIMMILFFYQAFLGLRIRRERKAGTRTFAIIKRHRKLGPIIAAFAAAGFLSGATLVYLDYGQLLKYPPHLITGMVIVALIASTFIVSRRIKAEDPEMRTLHYRLGLLILCVYPVQALLGIGMFF